jgi:hypothetical protein
MRISEASIFTDMAAEVYHRDPCPQPSLTQSLVKILIEKSPLHAWHAHPRLNPDYQHDDDTKFDVGNIAHKLLLARGKEIVVLDQFDDWRSKAAKEAREAAAKDGKIAVLGKKFALADRMVRAAREQLKLRGLGHFFRDGDAEVVMAWQERGFWCRQMLDWLIDRRIMLDFKTTDMSVAPHCIGRMMATAGWDVQAAMAERALFALAPDDPQKLGRRYLFVAQETETPYCLTVAELSGAALDIGRRKIEAAMSIWAQCIKANRWPGYPLEILRPEYPAFAEAAWLEREIHDAAQSRLPASDLIMAG